MGDDPAHLPILEGTGMKTVTTLREISRLAGVAPSTVSRALHGDPRISEATRRKILALAQESGYWSVAAKPIAVVIANPVGGIEGDAFLSEVIDGILAYRGTGRPVSVEVTDARPNGPLPRAASDPAYSGVIVAGIPIHDEWIHKLRSQNVPSVFIGKYTERPYELHAVVPDNVRGGRMVAEHLVACGYDEFWFVGGNLSIHTFGDRYRGFREGLSQLGYELNPAYVFITEPTAKSSAECLAAAIRKTRKRVGIFCATDWQASGALQAIRDAGRLVPEEFGVVGYSNLELAQHTSPALTTVHVDRKQLGALACRLLEDCVMGRARQPVQVVVQPSLIARGSTAVASR